MGMTLCAVNDKCAVDRIWHSTITYIVMSFTFPFILSYQYNIMWYRWKQKTWRPVGEETAYETYDTTCTRAVGFPSFRRPRNVRAAHGVAEVSSGGFYYFCPLISDEDDERSRRYPRSLSARSISPVGRRLGCLCRAPQPTGFPYEAGNLRPPPYPAHTIGFCDEGVFGPRLTIVVVELSQLHSTATGLSYLRTVFKIYRQMTMYIHATYYYHYYYLLYATR